MNMLKLYNSLTRKKEKFVALGKSVGVYSCGPTVYWYQHIGNLRSYVFADVLKRVLVYDGFDVKHVINVTDVGHLTSDADEGEDKLEKSAKKEGKTASEISHFYFDAFLEDFRKLNLIEPFKWVWASEHVWDMIGMVETLEKKGFTYRTEDGIYFDSSKVSNYGALARLRVESLEGGKRIKMGGKKNKTDFALWKFSKPEDNRQQEWESPWGIGFPGWHIECSAMASKYLGKQFDIHTGGEDNMPVHHVNEVAQSESAFGVKPWVRYWMHGAFLNIKGGKMSKSVGVIKTVSELEEDGYRPLVYRYFCYTASYRKPLTWSEDGIKSAVSSFKKLKNVCVGLVDDGKVNKKYLKEFEARIDDDLDMPGAVAVLWKLVRDERAEGKVGAIRKMDSVLGLGLLEGGKVLVPERIRRLANERLVARGEKDWGKSDEIRDKLNKLGWIIEDIKKGYKLRKK